MVNRKVNNKFAYNLIGLVTLGFTLYLLLTPVCAPCTFQYNNRNYNQSCPELCVYTPKWKILFFELTGKNLDYKDKPAITKQY